MSLKAKRNQRKKEKASSISETITACRYHVQRKYDEDLALQARLEREIPEDTARGKELKKAGATDAELENLARQINDKKLALFNTNSSKRIFGSTYSVLVELEAIIRVVYNHEWYRYIIRFVPHKRLPEMIKAENEGDVATILRLVKNANEKLKLKVLSSLHTDEEREDFRKRLEHEVGAMNDLFGSSKSMTSMFDDDEDEAENPNPTPVDANNSAANPNTAF